MPDSKGNLSIEELEVHGDALVLEAAAAGGTPEQIANASKRDINDIQNLLASADVDLAPTANDYFQMMTDSQPPGSSDAYIATNAGKLAALDAVESERDTEQVYNDAYKKLHGSFVDATMESAFQAYSDKMTGEVEALIAQDVSANPDNLENHVATLAGLDATKDIYSGLDGRNKALVDIYYKEGLANRSRRMSESQMYASDYFSQTAEDRSVLDKVVDGIGLVVDPMSFTFDIDDLAEIDPSAKGSNRFEQLKNIVGGFQSIDPDLQKEIAPLIIDKAWEAFDDNEYKVMSFIGLLYDQDYEDIIVGNAGLDVVEGATIIAPLVGAFRAAKGFKKIYNMRTQLRDMGNSEEAVKATTGPKNPLTDAMDADPMQWEDTVMGASNGTDELAPEFLAMHKRIQEEVVQPVRGVGDDDAFIKVDALSAAERDAAMQKRVDTLNKQDKDGIQYRNAAVLESNDKGFTVGYEIEDAAGVSKRDAFYNWTRDDAGSLIAVDQDMVTASNSFISSKLLSPEVVLRGFDDNLVGDVTFAGLQSATLRNSLAASWKATDKSFSSIPTITFKNGKPNLARGDARKAVDELLIAGDEAGQVWSVEKLRSGSVQTLSGKRKYTLPEIEAYYAKRAFLDEAHGLQNNIVKDKLNFMGYKEASWSNADGVVTTAVSKPIRDFRGLDKAENVFDTTLEGSGVWKVGDYGVDDITDTTQIVRLLKPIDKDGVTIKYAVVNTAEDGSKVGELPAQVLNKADGYVPRVSKPGYMYVKNIDNGDTIARFKTKANAENFAAQESARINANKLSGDKDVVFHAFRDRDFNAIDSVIEDSNSFGGLYTGARSRDGILAGDDLAGEVTRLSAGQSINRMMDSISFQMPLNEYRLGVINRWKETAKQALRNEGLEDTNLARLIDSDEDWADAPLNIINNNATRNMLESHRQYLKDSLKVAHNEENLWANKLMDIADTIPNGKARDLVVSVASKNPVTALKGATFDAYLGWFNPRQLYVQAQNAALAASMYPAQAARAIPEAMIQRVALYSKAVDKEMLTKAAKDTGMDSTAMQDMAEGLEQFKRSGLRDGVMRTGDYASNVGGFSTGTMETFRKASAAGRVFFEEGESFSRLISWNIARRNFKGAFPNRAIDDKAIREITDDALRMNMNMQRENAAWWQKNPFTSIPTQFLQVQAKLAENVVGGMLGNGKWTRKEASQVLAGQLFLYGTGGVVLAEGAASFLKEKTAGDELAFTEMNPTLSQALDRGMTGVFFNALGMENNFSESASIVAGLDDNVVVDLMVAFGDLAQGNTNSVPFKAPSFGVVKRGVDAFSSTFQAMSDVMVAPSVATMGDSIIKSIDSFAAITSTWSNARKARWLHRFGEIRDTRGNIIAAGNRTDDMNIQTVLAKAMGFPTDIEDTYYKQKMWNYDRKKAEQETGKALNKVWLEFKQDGNLEKYQGNLGLLMSEYDSQPMLKQRIINNQIRKIASPRSGIDRDLQKFLTDYVRSGGEIGTKSFQAPLVNEAE